MFQRDGGSRKRSSCQMVNLVKSFGDENETRTVQRLLVKHTPRRMRTTRSGCHNKIIPQGDPTAQKQWELEELPIFVRRGSRCATVLRTKLSRVEHHQCVRLSRIRHSWCAVSRNSVCGLGWRRMRRSSCEHPDKSEEKREPGPTQSEIQQHHETRRLFKLPSLRSGVHPAARMRMRWVITGLPDSILKRVRDGHCWDSQIRS